MGDYNYILTSVFWRIYRSLTKQEAFAFIAFVERGGFRSGTQLSSFAKTFYRMHQSGSAKSREEIYASALGNKKYHRQMMNNYLSELKKLLFRYLEKQWFEDRSLLQKLAISESLFSRGLLKEFEKEVSPEKGNQELRSPEEYYYQFRIGRLRDEFAATQSKKRKYDLLEPAIGHFKMYYLIEMLRMQCELVNRKNLRSQAYDEKQMTAFTNYFNAAEEAIRDEPLISLYHAVYCFLQDDTDDAAYHRYKMLLLRNVRSCSAEIARELCLYAQNQCIRHINKNNDRYLKELLDVYDLMLRENLMYDGPYMTQYTFKNYVTVALRLKAFDGAFSFIHKYADKLHPDQREDALHYNLAAVYYEENKFDAALTELNHISIADPVYYLDSRSILLKIYFRDNDFEALASLYHSVRVYLLRGHQLTRKQADLYRYLFLYTYRLSRIIQQAPYVNKAASRKKLEVLINKIQSADVANKTWLLGMAQALT